MFCSNVDRGSLEAPPPSARSACKMVISLAFTPPSTNASTVAATRSATRGTLSSASTTLSPGTIARPRGGNPSGCAAPQLLPPEHRRAAHRADHSARASSFATARIRSSNSARTTGCVIRVVNPANTENLVKPPPNHIGLVCAESSGQACTIVRAAPHDLDPANRALPSRPIPR